MGADGSTAQESWVRSNDPKVTSVVQQAHEELRQLISQRNQIMKRIFTVRQTIVGLANLFGDHIMDVELQELMGRKHFVRQPGFTKACRTVLRAASRPLTAREICDEIEQRFPGLLSRHKDPLASVTTVLNRLQKYGEATTSVRENTRQTREWMADREMH